MWLKKLIKRFLNFWGIVIVVYRDPDKGKSKDDLRISEYKEEGKRFTWLKQYNLNTIIDIGANEGQFANKILSIFPNIEVHCFEPLKDAYQELQRNFKNQQNVHLYNCGLGESNSEKEIFKNEYSPSSSLLPMLDLHKVNFDYAVDVVPERITIRKLDEVMEDKVKRPLLVKIDVQGYEMFVLKGGQSVIKQADVVIIETSFYPLYSGQPLFEDIYDYFKNAGYKYVGNIEQLLVPVDFKILQADAIFVKGKI